MENKGQVKKYERFKKEELLKQLGIYNNCLYEARTPKEVFDSLNEEEQELWKTFYSKNKRVSSIFNARLTAEINNALKAGYNANCEELKEVKEILFKSAKSDICITVANILCKYDTKYSFKILFEKGVEYLENAWLRYLVKTPKEIEEDLENGRMPFASFQTFSASFVKSALNKIIWQENRERSVFSINRSAQDKLYTVAHAIRNLQCKGNFNPTPEEVQNEILTFRKTAFSLTGIKKSMDIILNKGFLNEAVAKDFEYSGLDETSIQKLHNLKEELHHLLVDKIGKIPTAIWLDFCSSVESRDTTIKNLSTKYGVRFFSMKETIENIEESISDSIRIQKIIKKINIIRQ